MGAGRQQCGGHRRPRSVRRSARPALGRSGADEQRQTARSGHRNHPGRRRAGRRPAGRDQPRAGQPAAAVGNRRPAQALRHDGRRDDAVRPDQSDRSGRRQPDREHRRRVRAGDLHLHLDGAAAAVRHHRGHHPDSGDASAEPQRSRRRHSCGAGRPLPGHPPDDGHPDPCSGLHDGGGTGHRQRAVRLWQVRRGRCQLPGHCHRAVVVHLDPVRPGFAAAAGVLRPRRPVDTDPDDRRDHRRQDRVLTAGSARHHKQRAGSGLPGHRQRAGFHRRCRARPPPAAPFAASAGGPTARHRRDPGHSGDHGGSGGGRRGGRRGRSAVGSGAGADGARRRRRIDGATPDHRGGDGAHSGRDHGLGPGARYDGRAGGRAPSYRPPTRDGRRASGLPTAPQASSSHVP